MIPVARPARTARRPNTESLRAAPLALTGQQLAQVVPVEDVVAIDAGQVGPRSSRTGSDEHLVGSELAHELRRDLRRESDVDTERRHLSDQPVEQSLVRLVDERGEAERAAELRRLLAQDHLVSAQAGDPRRLESRRPAADDEDASALLGELALGVPDRVLLRGHRVHGASHRAVEEGCATHV